MSMQGNDHLWSEHVKTKWHPEPSFFGQSAEAIAEGLMAASDSERQAMDRLDFYINRAGHSLKDPEKFARARKILHDRYGRKA